MSDHLPPKILIVDDLPEKILAYRVILEDLGTIVPANSGEEALRAVLNSDFAVILLDVHMPGMSGLEAAALIHQRKRSAHTPIIFLTAFADEGRSAEGYAQGAVDYITTPVVPAVLRAKVRVFCELYRMSQLIRHQAEERIALNEERTRREAAEEANRRLAFSAKTGTILGQSLNQEVTRRDVVRLPLGFLADLAVLVVPNRNGVWITSLARATDPPDAVESGIGTGGIPPDLVVPLERALADSADDAKPNQASVIVPLRARSQPFAAIALSRAPSNRQFGPSDLTLIQAYASRASIALDNARLHHEVQEADRQKNEFLSMLAHELRNPLAPIRNANEILRHQVSDPAQIRWAQGVIDRQLSHLVRLVDDLLDVSRITQGKIRLSVAPVSLASMVNQAVEAVRPLIDQFAHHFESKLPTQQLIVHGDLARLTQIVTNLLNNAAKFTDPGGRISLTAIWLPWHAELNGTCQTEPATTRSGQIEIRVRDSGIGISPELLPTVFDLFTQGNRSLDRSQGGLGIGLTLVRRLVEIHGGTVEVHSEGLGNGSEFIVRLPAFCDEQLALPRNLVLDAGRPAARRALRIGVVDDNVDGAQSLADLLGLMGHRVELAHDGLAGLAMIRAFDPELVLLDIGLPGMNGYEVARQVRDEMGGRPVLAAISGYGRDEDRKQSSESGFAHHFVKPIDLERLKMLLDTLNSNSSSHNGTSHCEATNSALDQRSTTFPV